MLVNREEFEAQKQPYEDDICLCNTLIHYLQRFISNTDLDSSYPGVTVTPAALSSPSEESPPSGQFPFSVVLVFVFFWVLLCMLIKCCFPYVCLMDFPTSTFNLWKQEVNMVLNVHRNCKAY